MELRNEILSFIQHWNHRSEVSVQELISWLGIKRGRYYEWVKRKDKPNDHNAPIPKSHWVLEGERLAIINYAKSHLQAGYRRMTYLMLDEDIVAVSPSTTYRVLKEAGLIQQWTKRSSKGTGFEQPVAPHEHWHIDFTYLRIKDVFYFLVTVLDGYSRAILSWDLKPHMTQEDAQIVLQKAREKFPNQKPRVISDNGPQFVSRDFKSFINICDMTHVKTSPYYPQSNGKLERWHGSLKKEGLRPNSPLDEKDAKRIIERYINDYNGVRLHSAIGYVPPALRLEGKDHELLAHREHKLKAAIEHRKHIHQATLRTESEEIPFSSLEGNDNHLAAV